MKSAVEKSGMFFQMGFMRRFDPGYAAAKKQIDSGRIGMPLVFKATSRDPFRPSLEYANPKSSGGMLIDMGIHDFDLARWFMGDVRTVAAIGATIAYPELATVGDIDNAIASLTFDERQARRRRSDAQRHLRIRHLDRDPRARGHHSHRLSARDADHGDDEGQRRVARHRPVFHGAVPRRLHQSAAELRAERAATVARRRSRSTMAWRRCAWAWRQPRRAKPARRSPSPRSGLKHIIRPSGGLACVGCRF